MGNVTSSSDDLTGQHLAVSDRYNKSRKDGGSDNEALNIMNQLSNISDVDDLMDIDENSIQEDKTDDHNVDNSLIGGYKFCGLIENFHWSCKEPPLSDYNFSKLNVEPGTKNKLHILLSEFESDTTSLLTYIQSNPTETNVYDEEYQTPLTYACKMQNLPSKGRPCNIHFCF